MANKWTEPSVRDEDRLPWLESAGDDYADSSTWQKIAALTAIALLLVAAAVFVVSWYKNRAEPTGTGEVIAAPEGDYKVKPEQPGGMTVDGEGTTALATSQGKAGGGSINLNAAPEAPITGRRAGPDAGPKMAPSRGMTVPASGGRLAAGPTNVTPALSGRASGGSLVQLGAFPSQAEANTFWATMSRRFGYLAPLGHSVEKADVGGRAVYRLRVSAGSAGAAQTLCGKLKVAGEACFVPN